MVVESARTADGRLVHKKNKIKLYIKKKDFCLLFILGFHTKA